MTVITSSNPSLPPRISGQLRSILTLEISRFVPRGQQQQQQQQQQHHHDDDDDPQQQQVVKILWWGQAKPEEVRIPPPSSSNSVATVRYDVLTTTKHFLDYLRDAEKLFFEILIGEKEKRRIGFAMIDDLTRIVGEGNIFSHSAEVFDDGGDVVGSLRCQFTLQEVVVGKKKKEEEDKIHHHHHHLHHRTSNSSSSTSSNSRPIYRPPSKARKSPIDPRKKQSSPDTTSHSLPNSPLKQKRREHAKDEERPRVTFLEKDRRLSHSATNLSGPSSQDDNNGGLKRILIRSRQRLEESAAAAAAVAAAAANRHHEKAPPPRNEDASNKAGGPRPMLPSWNLSTSRLHFISTVVQVSVDVRSITWTPNVLDMIRDETRRPPRLVLKSRTTNRPRSAAGPKDAGRSASADPISFFVSFVVPPNTMTTNFCSRKVSPGSSSVVFNEKFVQPLVFKPDLLDIWWTTDLTFKVLTRSMKQRESTLIGEASIGLKYLLTDAKNSDGGVLRLPIYSGQKFFADHKLDSEIVGDLHLSFLLSQGGGRGGGSGNSNYRPVSPQRPVRDGETEEEETTRHPVHRHSKDEEKRSSHHRSSSTSRPDSSSSEDTSNEANLFCLLKVSDGRNFSLNSATKQLNLFVSTRFLNSADIVRSQTCWNSTRPAFNMMYYVPVKLDSDFLRRCHNNFLVIEVWNHGDPAQIVGVSMIPLQQFYLSFKNDSRTKTVLHLESPVIAVNGWMPVTNLFDGSERGEIKVTLAAGTDKQIKSLMPRVTPSTTESSEEPPSEHIYDSVDDSTTTTTSSFSSSHQPHLHIPARRKHDHDKMTSTTDEVIDSEKAKEKHQEKHDLTNDMRKAATDALNLKERQDDRRSRRHTFRTEIIVEEARSLPRVFNASKSEKILPSAFATFSPADNCTVATNVIPRSSNPAWHFKTERMLSTDLLTDPRRYFIVRLWHHYAREDVANLEEDHVIGFAAVDLRPMVAGFPSVSGWYNIMDFSGRCRGQIKVTLVPKVDVTKFFPSSSLRRDSEAFTQGEQHHADAAVNPMEYFVSAKYDRFPSHVVQHTEQIMTARSPTPIGRNRRPTKTKTEQSSTTYSSCSDISSRSSEESGGGRRRHQWQQQPPPPRVPTPTEEEQQHYTRSFLNMKLNEMDATTQKLRNKLDNNNGGGGGPSTVRISGVSLEELQADIESNLSNLRRSAGNLLGNDNNGLSRRSNLVTLPEVNLDNQTPSSTSAEIVDIMGNSDEEAISESLSQPILNTIRLSTLEDLGSIDWNNVGRTDNDNGQSRMRPEGGSPAEELRQSRQMNASSSQGNSSTAKK